MTHMLRGWRAPTWAALVILVASFARSVAQDWRANAAGLKAPRLRVCVQRDMPDRPAKNLRQNPGKVVVAQRLWPCQHDIPV